MNEHIRSRQATVLAALAGLAAAAVLLVVAGLYIWAQPLALCRQQTSSLFFGSAIGQDGKVEAADWSRFVNEVILPRFPDGFTIMDGQGVYRSARNGIVREPAHVLVVARPKGADADRKLEAIADDYKTRFHQESVLRLDQCGAYRF